MSRSALWRQEGNVKERERRAEEIYETVCTEGRTRSKATLSLWNPDNDTFHLNPLLLHNTIHSQYFQKCCTNLNDWNAIIDEIYYEVNHLFVFQTGTGSFGNTGGGSSSSSSSSSNSKAPSTAFCLLIRLLCYRMTAHELDQTIRHRDSPYIRAIGFLFIRYGGCPPEQVYDWIEPYLHDDTELSIEPQGVKQQQLQQNSRSNISTTSTTTIGEFVRKIFQEREYYGQTPLPRFPIQIERDIQVKLLAADRIAERAKVHICNESRMKYFQTIGSTIQALYGDDQNPIKWYKAVIDRVITRSEEVVKGETCGSGSGVDRDHQEPVLLKYPKFVVTFTEYGNTEIVLLGEIDVLDSDGNVHRSVTATSSKTCPGERTCGPSKMMSTGSNRTSRDWKDQSSSSLLHRTGNNNPNLWSAASNKNNYNDHTSNHDDNHRRPQHSDGSYHDHQYQQKHKNSYNSSSRSGSNCRSYTMTKNEDDDLYEEVRRAERDRVVSSDKGQWARRPPSTKFNLASISTTKTSLTGIEMGEAGKGRHIGGRGSSSSSSNHAGRMTTSTTSLDDSRPYKQQQQQQQPEGSGFPSSSAALLPPKKRTAEEIAAIEEKKRKLLSKYG